MFSRDRALGREVSSSGDVSSMKSVCLFYCLDFSSVINFCTAAGTLHGVDEHELARKLLSFQREKG